jgi:tetratricopeptide (TPR) repeat protein
VNKCISELPIGEILVRAGLITQPQLDLAVEEAGTRARLLGKTLVNHGVLSPDTLRAALEAQSVLRDGVVDSFKAFKALSIAAANGVDFATALAQISPVSPNPKPTKEQTSKLGELLLAADVLDAKTLEAAQQKVLSTGEPLGVILVADGHLKESFLDAALELQVRVRDGMFSREQAIFALRQDPRKLLAMIAPHMMADEIEAKKAKAAIRIGELLVRAGILSTSNVNQALELSLAQGQQIGEMLVARGFISKPLLDATLSLQQMATLGHLTTGEATACLIKVNTSNKSVAECILELNGLKSKPGVRQAQKLGRRASQTNLPGFIGHGQDSARPNETSTDLPAMSVKDRQTLTSKVEETVAEAAEIVETETCAQTVSQELDKPTKSLHLKEDLLAKIRQIQIDTEELRQMMPADDTSFESFEPSDAELAAASRFEEFFGANFAFVKEHREEFYRGLREAYARLGRVFLKRRQLDQSEDLLKSALELSYTAPIEDKKVEDLMFLACLYLAHGKSWQSERLLKTCLAILEAQKSPENEASSIKLIGLCHHRLALVYCHLSLLFKAEKHFKTAVRVLGDEAGQANATIQTDNLTKRRLAAVYKDYAVLLNRMRREQEADKYYSQARRILSSSLRTG